MNQRKVEPMMPTVTVQRFSLQGEESGGARWRKCAWCCSLWKKAQRAGNARGMCYKYDVKGWLIVPIMAECAACTHYGKVCHMHTLRQSVPHAHTVAQCAACADYCTACLQRSKSYPFVLMLCPAKRG
eukprot:scaffold52630_cov22-Tisochrysis_lutea.AAC.2